MDTMLPIGSVVELENDDNRYVILGYLHQRLTDNTLNIYQYTACEYSLGFDEKNELLYFDEEKIDSIIFMGYTIQTDRVYLKMLYDMYREISNGMSYEQAMDNVLKKYFGDDEDKKKEIKEKTINSFANNMEGGSDNG